MFARIVFAALALAAAPPALAADDVTLPPVTPVDGYFVMTRDDATTSSKCIGDPRTPICAVETELACRVRADFELCRIAMGLETTRHINKGPPHGPHLYRVVRGEVLTDRHFPWRPSRRLPWRPGEIDMQPGDVRIDITYQPCGLTISPASCSYLYTLAFIVRREGNRWAVMTAGDPYDTRK